MAHAQFDDLYGDHPKIAGLTDAAFRLHTCGIIYCSRHLSDGLIQAGDVPRLVRKYRKAALAELLDCGVWLPVLESAYLIHDYLDWNPSRDEVERRRALAAKRKAAWRAAHDDEQ